MGRAAARLQSCLKRCWWRGGVRLAGRPRTVEMDRFVRGAKGVPDVPGAEVGRPSDGLDTDAGRSGNPLAAVFHWRSQESSSRSPEIVSLPPDPGKRRLRGTLTTPLTGAQASVARQQEASKTAGRSAPSGSPERGSSRMGAIPAELLQFLSAPEPQSLLIKGLPGTGKSKLP